MGYHRPFSEQSLRSDQVAIPEFQLNTRTEIRIKETKQLEEAKYQLEVAQRQGQSEVASRLRYSTIPELAKKLPMDKETGEDSSCDAS